MIPKSWGVCLVCGAIGWVVDDACKPCRELAETDEIEWDIPEWHVESDFEDE